MNKKDFYADTGLDDQGNSMELDDQGLDGLDHQGLDEIDDQCLGRLDDQGLDGLDDQCNAMDRVEMFFHILLHPLLANIAHLKQNMNYSEKLAT